MWMWIAVMMAFVLVVALLATSVGRREVRHRAQHRGGSGSASGDGDGGASDGRAGWGWGWSDLGDEWGDGGAGGGE